MVDKMDVTAPQGAKASPYHAGEKKLQALYGLDEMVEAIGRKVFRPFMPEQHRAFFDQLPFIAIGAVDEEGWPWASILSGHPGFVGSPDNVTLEINALPALGNPLSDGMKNGAPIGLLGIELPTRRRNRVNGRISQKGASGFTFSVDQSFGNCPQYIQTRSVDFVREPEEVPAKSNTTSFDTIDDDIKNMIASADTFFVSSYIKTETNPRVEGVDVSHRGGRPGFIKVEGDVLTIPDFPGNNFYNTFGNFLINPKAGLVFADFETGDMLMLTGTVELILGDDNKDQENDQVRAFKGAERAWRFKLHRGVMIKDALPFRSVFEEYSPNVLLTGDWQQSAAALSAEEKRNMWRPFKLSHIEDESSVIRSFFFKPNDGDGLLSFEAGQFLTIRVTPDETQAPKIRTYTISSAPNDDHYRISVRREEQGVVSQYLHDKLQPGDVIDAKAPSGDFFIKADETRPAVLMAGGVGVTPMMSMARHVALEGMRTRSLRPLTIFHSAQTTEQRAFAKEFAGLQQATNNGIKYYSLIDRPVENERAGVDFNGAGYITADLLRQTLALDDYDFYLCGPGPFMQSVYDILRELGVDDRRIFAEAFGPASLNRQLTEEESVEASDEEAEEADHAVIMFSKSGFEQGWSAGDDTLLEVAESHGLTPDYGCRSGMCGTCAVKLKSGAVSYRMPPTADHGDDEVLICCAVPAKGSETIDIDL